MAATMLAQAKLRAAFRKVPMFHPSRDGCCFGSQIGPGELARMHGGVANGAYEAGAAWKREHSWETCCTVPLDNSLSLRASHRCAHFEFCRGRRSPPALGTVQVQGRGHSTSANSSWKPSQSAPRRGLVQLRPGERERELGPLRSMG